ncbi:MAG: hypothetical protein K5871_10105 [Lachnospiraceae bacterium]|nr:hypothetical protein [Lachnospiraceae bacterium]
MGFLSKLFKIASRKKLTFEEPENEEVVYDREGIDFHDQTQRTRYIAECLEQMAEGSREIDLLKGEYDKVTSYLRDMEEIEALPAKQRTEVNVLAKKLVEYESDIEKFRSRKSALTDEQFASLRRREKDIPSGLESIKENERMAVLIKKDLKRLDGERKALAFRRNELFETQDNMRGMAIIFTVAAAALMLILAVMQFAFGMNVYIGYFLCIACVAIALTVVCVKYIDAEHELDKTSGSMGKLIQLQNTVKIRYVNNRNLLSYLYIKFECKNGKELEQLWSMYTQEAEDRRQFNENSAGAVMAREDLIRLLGRYHVASPARWVDQIPALLDKREMVELRHGYILRRQSLREQIDYNDKLARSAKNEITDIAKSYPMYAQEILEMTEKFEPEGPE